MLVHHCGNHGGAGAKGASHGGGGFTGRGDPEGRGGSRGGGGRILEQISVLQAQLRFRTKACADGMERRSEYYSNVMTATFIVSQQCGASLLSLFVESKHFLLPLLHIDFEKGLQQHLRT